MSQTVRIPMTDRALFREFRDAAGADWKVWEVIPSDSSVRALGSIGHALDGARSATSDAAQTKRETQNERRARWTRGWLLFESGTTRRRLKKIPEGWAGKTDAELAALCAQAEDVGDNRS
jgi:hypothetical protein